MTASVVEFREGFGIDGTPAIPENDGEKLFAFNFPLLLQHVPYSSTTDPGLTDDAANTSGNGPFAAGSRWTNTQSGKEWLCEDATTNEARWVIAAMPSVNRGQLFTKHKTVRWVDACQTYAWTWNTSGYSTYTGFDAGSAPTAVTADGASGRAIHAPCCATAGAPKYLQCVMNHVTTASGTAEYDFHRNVELDIGGKMLVIDFYVPDAATLLLLTTQATFSEIKVYVYDDVNAAAGSGHGVGQSIYSVPVP
jgi:hypothetical protein